jgi:phosphoenolpyruvate-protein phosphotransferase (PTS system enzyme I)
MEKGFVLYGTVISPGIAIGKPYFLLENRKVLSKDITSNEVEKEILRYRGALDKSRKSIEHLQKKYIQDGGASVVVEILDSHLEILHDPMITQIVEEKIKQKQKNTEAVFFDFLDEYKKSFQNIDDEFVQERIKDITDVSRRILSHLSPFGSGEEREGEKEKAIIIAEDLIPSDTIDSKIDEVQGFITKKGGFASHSGIITRARGIPFVSKIDVDRLTSVEIKCLIVDGVSGKVYVNPNKKTVEEYTKLLHQLNQYIQEMGDSDSLQAITKDKVKISLLSNIESKEDIPLLLEKNADGIGLFRSEYLFLTEKALPTEERQFQIYKEVLKRMGNKPVVIRLFDIGGDKNHFIIEGGRSCLKLQLCEKEQNPILGCRGIRFLIKNEKIFDEQLRALLRASIHGNLKILIPLLSDVIEYRLVKRKIQGLSEKLRLEGKRVVKNIPLGCMVEVPSAAIMVDELAQEADFLSIGTNDLTQYVMATDRANHNTCELYDFSHPALLRFINMVVRAGKKNKKEVTICGEMAGDVKFTELLLGLGLRSFSIAIRNIPLIKHMIRNSDLSSARKKAFDAERAHLIDCQ